MARGVGGDDLYRRINRPGNAPDLHGGKADNAYLQAVKYYAFDTEDDGAANFTQGGVYDGNRYEFFDTREEMGRFMGETRGAFYTFNLEYDLVSLYWPDLAVVRYWRSSGRILSARVGVASLFDLVWGMGGVGMAFSAALIGKQKTALDARSRDYLRNDLDNTCAVLQRLIKELDDLGAGKPRGTLAGASLRTFKAFGGEVAPFPPALESVVRAAYYGGRTECFDYRERVVNGYDVNSMFPAAMLQGDFPAGRYKSVREWESADFIRARVHVPKMHVPPLPVRDERLLFPQGTFTGSWAREELAHAVAMGATVERVYHAFAASARVRPFDVFCATLFERRKKDKFSNYYAKRLLNSLYGKMAQQGTLEYVQGPMNCQEVKELSLPVRDYNPAWPAIITARARVTLHKLLIEAEGSLVYCDTDSVFVAMKHAGRFSTGTGLGELKLEHERARMKVLSPKLYRLREGGETFYRARGVPERVAAEFYELGHAEFKKPMRLREAIKRNLPPNVWTSFEKSFGVDGFEKRTRLKDGRTVPLIIGA